MVMETPITRDEDPKEREGFTQSKDLIRMLFYLWKGRLLEAECP